MNVFITGVGGFAGAYLTRHLLRKGHRVAGLTRNSIASPLLGEVSDRWALTHGDLVALRALPDGVDAIVHAAASSPGPASSTRTFVHDNVLGTENLVALATERAVGKFVFFSSLSVYGTITLPVADESTPVVNPDAYGASKLLGEYCLRECSAKMASIALRLPAVLGRGASRHWLAVALARAGAGNPIDIYNPDAVFNNAVHIEDLCAFVEEWLGRPTTGFDAVTLGACGGMTIREIASRVVSATESSSRIVVSSSARPSFTVSSRRAQDVYDYVPVDFRSILDRYLAETSRA